MDEGDRRQRRSPSVLEGVVAALARSDPYESLELRHPDLPVADLAGAGGLCDDVDDLVGLGVIACDLDHRLRNEVDPVLRPSVDLRVPTLATEALRFGDRHAVDAD